MSQQEKVRGTNVIVCVCVSDLSVFLYIEERTFQMDDQWTVHPVRHDGYPSIGNRKKGTHIKLRD